MEFGRKHRLDKFYLDGDQRKSLRNITPENLEPNPKNPIIASFFRNIGYADQLGSGVRNLFKYSKYYSGQEPEFIEGDVFRIIVPLDDQYSYDQGKSTDIRNPKVQNGKDEPLDEPLEIRLRKAIGTNPKATYDELAEVLHVSRSTVKRIVKEMISSGIISREGGKRYGFWKINE